MTTRHERSDREPLSRVELMIVTSLFIALTLALTYPQVLSLATHTGTHYDALFSIWRLGWIAHQLREDPLRLFDANIFYPQPRTLAYSDAILLLGVAGAPALWAGMSLVVVYNLLVLASFVAAGVAMYALTRTLTNSGLAGTLGGTVFAFQSYRFAHFPQLELLWTCWIPVSLLALHRVLQAPTAKRGALLGLSIALQALSCLYYAVFLVTFLPLIALGLTIARRARIAVAHWHAAAVSVVVAAVIVGPYAVPYLGSSAVVANRRLEDVANWSPRIESYFSAQGGHLLYPGPAHSANPFEGVLFPGIVAVVLALWALAVADNRRLVTTYAIVLVLAFDLSLGVNGILYRWLFDVVPIYRGLRVPARLFVMVSAALAVLAAMAVAHIEAQARRGRLIATVLVVLVLIESVSVPIPLDRVPQPSPRVHGWLAHQPRAPVFEWPTPRPSALGITHEPQYMFYSTRHWQPLVNGYSGNYPQSYVQLLERTRDFPSQQALEYLRRVGVRYVIVHSFPGSDDYFKLVAELGALESLQFALSEVLHSPPSPPEEVALYLLAPADAGVSRHGDDAPPIPQSVWTAEPALAELRSRRNARIPTR